MKKKESNDLLIAAMEVSEYCRIEKMAHELTMRALTDDNGEFVHSTIGAEDFKNGVICGYKKAIKDYEKEL